MLSSKPKDIKRHYKKALDLVRQAYIHSICSSLESSSGSRVFKCMAWNHWAVETNRHHAEASNRLVLESRCAQPTHETGPNSHAEFGQMPAEQIDRNELRRSWPRKDKTYQSWFHLCLVLIYWISIWSCLFPGPSLEADTSKSSPELGTSNRCKKPDPSRGSKESTPTVTNLIRDLY